LFSTATNQTNASNNKTIRQIRKITKAKKLIINQNLNNVENLSENTRQTKWEHAKILTLVTTKPNEHLAKFDKGDDRDQFETTMTKWKTIVVFIMNAMEANCLQN
jgi:hypothetical protein